MKSIFYFKPWFDKLLLLALLGVITTQLYTIFDSHRTTLDNPQKFISENYSHDFISQYGKRFTEASHFFIKPTRLNYIGEKGEDQSSGWTNYFLTQYYMAPNLVLKDNHNLDTVIYNLYNTIQIDPTSNYHLNNGWHIVKDFNNGLIILAK